MPDRQVPEAWWRAACETVTLPLACVSEKNKFVWVNSAFEKLVGYSCAELFGKTWMEITVQEDVGGDLASVKSVVSGNTDAYSLSKKYRHKFGHEVPVTLSVWRFPQSVHEVLSCFIVEAQPQKVSHHEFMQVIEKLQKKIAMIETEQDKLEANQKSPSMSMHVGGDYSGKDKNTNSDSSIKFITMALIALGTAFFLFCGWMMYYMVFILNPQIDDPEPPPKSVSSISRPLEANLTSDYYSRNTLRG